MFKKLWGFFVGPHRQAMRPAVQSRYQRDFMKAKYSEWGRAGSYGSRRTGPVGNALFLFVIFGIPTYALGQTLWTPFHRFPDPPVEAPEAALGFGEYHDFNPKPTNPLQTGPW